MICNLESEGEEKGALSLCSAFLKRQLLQGDVYCAWWVPPPFVLLKHLQMCSGNGKYLLCNSLSATL